MMRKILVPAAALAAAAPAFAADLPPREPPPVYDAAVPLFTWTGLYLGGQIGYAWGTDTLTVFPFGFGTNFTPNGVVGGAHIGYNLQLNQFVAGLEGDVEGISTSFSPGGVLYHTSIPVQGSIRGRLGVAFDRALLYAMGGAAFAGFETSVTGFPTKTRQPARAGLSAAASNMPSPAIGRSGPNTATQISAASRTPRPTHSASAPSSIIARPKTPFARASATNSIRLARPGFERVAARQRFWPEQKPARDFGNDAFRCE